MKKNRSSEERQNRDAGAASGQVKTADVSREHGGISKWSGGWKRIDGGMQESETQLLKAAEDENRRLKLLVADLSLHCEELKSVIRKNGWRLPV